MINPTINATELKESMFHINYKMHQSTDLSMDIEIKAEGLCWMKCINIYDHMKQWDDLLLNKY